MDKFTKYSSIKNWILFGSILSLGYLVPNKIAQAEVQEDSLNEEQNVVRLHPVDPLDPSVEITPVPHQQKKREDVLEPTPEEGNVIQPNRSDISLPNGDVPEQIKVKNAPKYPVKRFCLVENQAVILNANEDDEGDGGTPDEPSYISQVCAGITGRMLFGVKPKYDEE